MVPLHRFDCLAQTRPPQGAGQDGRPPVRHAGKEVRATRDVIASIVGHVWLSSQVGTIEAPAHRSIMHSIFCSPVTRFGGPAQAALCASSAARMIEPLSGALWPTSIAACWSHPTDTAFTAQVPQRDL